MPSLRFPPLRRILRGLLAVLAVLLIVPILQIGVVRFWDIPWSPMEAQRALAGTPGRAREWVKIETVPAPLLHFLWASEDQQFFSHHGFDWDQLRRTLEESGTKGRGSSTITMQTARSAFLWQGRSYVRKALEAYYTFWMEVLLPKKRIFELYLNHIEWGPGIYGLGAAAREHFHCRPGALTRRQMLALAAVLPNPLEWSPVTPDATVERKIRRVERLASRAPFPADRLR
jgi:monofunctional biosynthetic peptidoglycan transglycosylase